MSSLSSDGPIEIGTCSACSATAERGPSGAWWHVRDSCLLPGATFQSGFFLRSCAVCGSEQEISSMNPVEWYERIDRITRKSGVKVNLGTWVCRDCYELSDEP